MDILENFKVFDAKRQGDSAHEVDHAIRKLDLDRLLHKSFDNGG